jgi:hypothetical protein
MPLPSALPLRPDTAPPFRRPPIDPDPPPRPFPRLASPASRAAYETARDAAIRARRPSWWPCNT